MRSMLLALASATLLLAADVAQEGARWWSHIQVLADDKMEGRNTGSEGHRRAAQFVASEFERAGLAPAGTSGYFQPVKLDVRTIDEPASNLALMRDGKATPLTLGEDASFSLRADLAPHVEAPAVFVGHGLVIPEMHIDELAGLDLKGKIAVFVNGGPSSIPEPTQGALFLNGRAMESVPKGRRHRHGHDSESEIDGHSLGSREIGAAQSDHELHRQQTG